MTYTRKPIEWWAANHLGTIHKRGEDCFGVPYQHATWKPSNLTELTIKDTSENINRNQAERRRRTKTQDAIFEPVFIKNGLGANIAFKKKGKDTLTITLKEIINTDPSTDNFPHVLQLPALYAEAVNAMLRHLSDTYTFEE